MPFNDLTSATWYDYNKADFKAPNTYAQDMQNINSSVNALYENAILGKNLNFDLQGVGVYTNPRNEDEDRFMKTLFKTYDATTAIRGIENAIKNPGVANNLKSQALGPSLEYIDTNNGDQARKFGLLMVDAVNDEGFRKVITNYSLSAYKANATDPSATAIPVPTDLYNGTTEIFFPASEAGFFSSGACECRPLTGNCANGYRVLYIIKKRNFDPGAVTIRETVAVQEVKFNPRGDGGVSIVIKRGLSRKNPNETTPGSGVYTFEDGTPVPLVPGDILLFGNVIPTTQCLPEMCCVKASPKFYSYCSVSQRHIDCIYEDRPSSRLQQQRDQLPWHIRHAYEMNQQMRDVVHRLFNTAMTSQSNYAAGQRRPIDVIGTNPLQVEYNDCDVVPYTTRGILPTIEAFGQKMSHYFTDCNDSCGQFKLGRLWDVIEASIEGSNTLNNPGWLLVGDTKPLTQYQASLRAYTNVLPNNYAEAQAIENMKGASFRPDAKSLFGSNFDANSTGISSLRFGNMDIKGMHDSTMAIEYANTAWFMNISAFDFFAPDQNALNTLDLGFNPYLEATGVRGKLAPVIWTQDLVPTMINGNMDWKARKNCGLKFQMYLEFGIHPKAEYLPHMTKFTYGAKVLNESFNPANPEGPSNLKYRYTRIEDLDCGCANALNAIDNSLAVWSVSNR